jgi:hypothetical protein
VNEVQPVNGKKRKRCATPDVEEAEGDEEISSGSKRPRGNSCSQVIKDTLAAWNACYLRHTRLQRQMIAEKRLVIPNLSLDLKWDDQTEYEESQQNLRLVIKSDSR